MTEKDQLKDQVVFIDSQSLEPSQAPQSSQPSEKSESDPQSAFNEETGEINWVILISKI